MLVATNIFFSRQNVCRNKHNFVASSLLLSRQNIYACNFVKVCLSFCLSWQNICRDKSDTWQWQSPMIVYRCLVLQIWEYMKDTMWEGQFATNYTGLLRFISAIDTCDRRMDQSSTTTSVIPTSGHQQGCQNSHVTTGNAEHGGREYSDGEYVGKVCVCVGGGGSS